MQTTTVSDLTKSGIDNKTETSTSLLKILNIYYTSGIDRIKTYGKTPSGNIVGEFIADGTTFQYILNINSNTISYEPVGIKSINKADSLLAERENADRFKTIYSAPEAFEISEVGAIEQKLDSWFFRADAPTKAKIGVKAKANKSGKTLTCTPGRTFPCGAVCRVMGKPCKQPMSPEVQEIAKQVAAKIATPTVEQITTPKPVETTTSLPRKQIQKNPAIKDETTFMSLYIEDIKCQGEKCKKIESTDPDPLITEGFNLNPIIVKELPDRTYEVVGNHSVYAQMRNSERAYCLVLGKHSKPFDETKIAKMAPAATTTVPLTGTTLGKVTAQQMAEQIAASKALQPDTDKKTPNSSKLFAKLINTKRIEPPTEEFDANDLRAAAETSLELGGFVEPPVVRRVGSPLDQKYEIISGQFQIAAAIVARAIDPLRGEIINVIVIEEENEKSIAKQMKAQKNANKNN
jgi:hypothetical protein